MVVFCSWNLKVPGSNPVKVNFFLIFSFSGQVRVQTPLEFTWFFPTWNLIIFTIYEFLALLLTYNKQKNRWGIWSYLEWILTPVPRHRSIMDLLLKFLFSFSFIYSQQSGFNISITKFSNFFPSLVHNITHRCQDSF